MTKSLSHAHTNLGFHLIMKCLLPFFLLLLCSPTASLQAQVAAEEVSFSRSGGLITSTIRLDIDPPAESGAVVRFTLDRTEPSESSPIWSQPMSLSSTTHVRARVYAPGKLPGPVKSRHFIRLGASLTNYRSSGKAFSSTLPLVVIEPFGEDIDNDRLAGVSYAVTIRPDATGRARLTGTVEYQGNSQIRVRGETSSWFDQRPYKWEIQNEDGTDRAESLLGMPANSDWALYAPYNDKTLMRNEMVYSLMRKLNGEGSAMRTQYCEVFVSNTPAKPLGMDDYRGVYVLIELIKQGNSRVNIAKLDPLDTAQPFISGGYIFRIDKPSRTNHTFMTNSGVELQVVEPKSPNLEQADYLESHLNAFEFVLFGENFADPVAGYSAFIDPLSFMDNQWFVEITKQIDGYRLSSYFSKDRGKKIRALPLWDYNLSLGNADYLNGQSPFGWYHDLLAADEYPWYGRLHEDPTYQLQYWDRYWQLRKGLFSNASVLAEISKRRARLMGGRTEKVTNHTSTDIQTPVARHFRRWPVLGTYVWPNPAGYRNRTSYQLEVSAMTSFLTRRLAWIDRQNAVNNVIFRPPVFSLAEGSVKTGSSLVMTRYRGTPPAGYSFATGTLYYTTDGSDPRAANGSPQGTVYTRAIQINRTQTVKARLLSGNNWSPLNQATYVVCAVAPSIANVTITELMYHASEPTPEEITLGFTDDGAFDWLELSNLSSTAINLTTLRLTNGVLFDFSKLPASSRVLPVGKSVLLAENRAGFEHRYGTTLAQKVIGEYTGGLSNSGENVTLSTSTGAILKDFTYNDSSAWPLADGTGASLEQTRPTQSPNLNLPTSWRASTTLGGTPGTR